MTSEVIAKIEAFFEEIKTDLQPVETEVVTDAKAIGTSALAYIKSNGLTELYSIAKSALLGLATGTPWATVAADVVSQGEAAGIAIAKGAETIVLAQAQADLIAAGTLVAPSTGAVVASTFAPAATAPVVPAA
jgi:hypothetical protein